MSISNSWVDISPSLSFLHLNTPPADTKEDDITEIESLYLSGQALKTNEIIISENVEYDNDHGLNTTNSPELTTASVVYDKPLHTPHLRSITPVCILSIQSVRITSDPIQRSYRHRRSFPVESSRPILAVVFLAAFGAGLIIGHQGSKFVQQVLQGSVIILSCSSMEYMSYYMDSV